MTPGKTAFIVISVLIIIALALGLGLGLGLKSDDSSTTTVPVEWVLVGKNTDSEYKNLLFTTDGSTWMQSESSGKAFNKEGYDVAYGYGSDGSTPLWVAVGDEDATGGTSAGTIMYSTDGKTWSESTGISFPKVGGAGYGVAYGLSNGTDPLWVAVGKSGGVGTSHHNILYSTDGKNWAASGAGGMSLTHWGSKAAYGKSGSNSIWVAGGRGGGLNGTTYTQNILYSTGSQEGQYWEASTGASLLNCQTVAFGLSSDGTSLWLAGGTKVPGAAPNFRQMLRSTDGKVWEVYDTDSFGTTFTTEVRGLAFGTSNGEDPLWVACGKDSTPQHNLMWSEAGGTGGMHFVPSIGGDTFNMEANNVAYRKQSDGSALWIAVGENSTGPSVMHSTNGKTWHYFTSTQAGFKGLQEMFGVASDRILYDPTNV